MHGRLQSRLKKGNGRLGKATLFTLDSSMKKMAADSKAKGKKPGSTHGQLGQWLSGNGCWIFIQTKLLNSSTHWHGM